MENTKDVDLLAAALVAFQADMENVAKDATNPFFKSKYATLEAIITTAKPHLKKHGLAVVQFPVGRGLKTIILHRSGQFLAETADLIIKDETPQGQGSGITYMRRYAYSGALGIATEDDDDGNEATKSSPLRQAARTATKPAETKKDPAIELAAAKDRTMTLLKMLWKGDLKTKKQCEDAVFDLTGYILADKDIETINERLAALVEKDDAKQ
jgi:hypothetical protein